MGGRVGVWVSLPKTLSCVSGSCLEARQGAKRLELRRRLTAAERTLRHLTVGTAIQTPSHAYTRVIIIHTLHLTRLRREHNINVSGHGIMYDFLIVMLFLEQLGVRCLYKA